MGKDAEEMNILDRAATLKREADHVLRLIRLMDILQPYGKITPTGSYFLDVMAYPDIDLYITRVSIEQLFEIGAKIAACDLVTQMVFERSDNPILLPEGLYLKTRVNYGDWGRPWKVDLWSLAEDVIQTRMADMRHFQQQMTFEIRQQIIRYKLSVMTSLKRTPMYSGYFIYKAFIDEAITDFEEITRYLISNGIQVQG